jgi:hypothetical protein
MVSKMQTRSRMRFQDGTCEEVAAATPLSEKDFRSFSQNRTGESRGIDLLPNCVFDVCASPSTEESQLTRRLEAESSTKETAGSELASTVCILVGLGSKEWRQIEPVKEISDRDKRVFRRYPGAEFEPPDFVIISRIIYNY